MKSTPQDKTRRETALYKAVLQLETPAECRSFFADLCTPAEVEAMADRWEVALRLMKKESYRAIAARTGVSLVTIGRVARFLNGDHKGYQLALKRLGEWNDE